jgi:antitoxin component of MazEF toxin-antitoxin module
MKKILKRIGNSIGITLTREERKILDVEEDDIIEVEHGRK